MPQVSVVIPAWNAADTLGVQLRALVDQEDAPPFEVIVADNGSTDGTAAVAESFAARLDLRVVNAAARRGPSFARNSGYAAARTDCILFCDADDQVAPGWVAAMGRALGDEALVTGPVIYVDEVHPDGAPPLPRRLPTAPRRFLEQVPFAPSSNLAAHRSVLEDVNGFDLDLRCGQDADLTIRAQLAGYRLAWAQDAAIFHARRSSLSGAARQFFRYGYYNPLIYRKLRNLGLSLHRPAWGMIRPYLVLAVTVHRLFTGRRWSWIVNASQRLGMLAGSVRFRTFCP